MIKQKANDLQTISVMSEVVVWNGAAIAMQMQMPEMMDEDVRHMICSANEGNSEFHTKQCIIPKIAPENADRERNSAFDMPESSEKKTVSKI